MNTKYSGIRVAKLLLLSSCFVMLWSGCFDLPSYPSDPEDPVIPPPPLNSENILAGPMQGYQYLHMDPEGIFGGAFLDDSLFVQQLILNNEGGSVFFQNPTVQEPEILDWWHGVVIEPGDINEDVYIGMLMPCLQVAVLEFSPHPYQFEGNIQMEFSYAGTNLAELGLTPEDLEIMYWNDELGQYEVVSSTLREDIQKIVVAINHFSRYIIAVGD